MSGRSISIKAGLSLSIRLTTYILITGVVLYWLKYPRLLAAPFLIYSFMTLSLPALFILEKWFDVRFLTKAIHILQTVLEISIVAGIIYLAGSISSAYSALFILTIISAALATNLAGTLSVATLISISYAYVVWFGLAAEGLPDFSSRTLEAIFLSRDAAFYNIFLHILTFYLVAFVSGFLVERLKSKDRELADTSQALRQAKLETDDILCHLNSGLLTIDKDGKIIFFNRAAKEILGFEEAEARGRDFQDIFAGRMPQLADNLRDVLRTEKQNPRHEITIINKYGVSVPIGISTSLLLDADRNVRGVIAIFQDLTDTKRLEEKMRVADKMAAVGELSAAIAHEIRNPLAAISGSVELLRNELNVADENQRLMNLIVRESSRLNNILSDFLMYARGRRSTFTRVELCHLVSDVIEVVRHHPSYRNNIVLRLLAAESFIYVFGDEDQIRQVLINLVVNACDAIGDSDGEITVEIETEKPGQVTVKVIDTGPGISEADIDRIFAPFYSTKKDGTGLGLAIVQRLSGNLDIDLAVHSRPGKGTTFILNFNQVPGRGRIPRSGKMASLPRQ